MTESQESRMCTRPSGSAQYRKGVLVQSLGFGIKGPLDLRLVNKRDQCQDQVKDLYQGSWWTVCDNN